MSPAINMGPGTPFDPMAFAPKPGDPNLMKMEANELAERDKKKKEQEKKKKEEEEKNKQANKPQDKSRPISSTPIAGTPWYRLLHLCSVSMVTYFQTLTSSLGASFGRAMAEFSFTILRRGLLSGSGLKISSLERMLTRRFLRLPNNCWARWRRRRSQKHSLLLRFPQTR